MEVTDEPPGQRRRVRRNIVSVVAIAASMTAATVALVVTRHTAPSTVATPSTQVLTGPVAVSIRDFAFAPAVVTVRVGTVVTWTNADTDAHTVRTTATLKSGVLDTNGTYTYTFTTPGTYAYHCSIHPEMHATITITP